MTMWWPTIMMYLLGVMLVLGLVEPASEEHENAPIKLALTWPLAAVMFMWAMIMDSFNDG